MSSRLTRIVTTSVALVLALGACSQSSSVGEGVEVLGEGGGQGALRDPKATTTTAALDIDNPNTPTTVASSNAALGGDRRGGSQASTTTTQATQETLPPTTTTTRGVEEYTVKIQNDSDGHFMEPLLLQAPSGAKITWKNVSSQTRQLQASNGAFASPDIAPGASWSWMANVGPGTINYKDTTRPYSSAQIQIY